MGWVGGATRRDRPPAGVLVYIESNQNAVNVAVGANVIFPPALFDRIVLDRDGWATDLANGWLTVPAGFAGLVRVDAAMLLSPGAGVLFAEASWRRSTAPLPNMSGHNARYSGTPGGIFSLHMPPLFVDVVAGQHLGFRLDCQAGSLNQLTFWGNSWQLTALDR